MSKLEKFNLKNTIDLPVIESAGGLVCNHYHHILLMFKRGKWDMPKGRIEQGQCREEAALREVHEEPGLDIDKLTIIGHAKSMIISNTDLIKYNDKVLFIHQKELFTRMKEPVPKLIFYIAPT